MRVSTVTGPINSPRQLSAILGVRRTYLDQLSGRAGAFYEPFDIVRPGKRDRHIDNPRPELKSVQRRVLRKLLEPISLPPEMTGGVATRSTKDHTRPHVGAGTIVTLDIKHCFPRTSSQRVFRAFRQSVSCGSHVADLLTKLTTFEGHLPQGAPTSSFLCNLALLDLHADLASLALREGFAFSIYVDDIAISGPGVQNHIDSLIAIVQKHGHHVRREKIKILHPEDSHTFVGQTVNRKQAASSRFRSRLRLEILELANSETILAKRLRSVRSKILHVSQLDAVQGAALRRFADRHLPAEGIAGDVTVKRVTKKCRGWSRHRLE